MIESRSNALIFATLAALPAMTVMTALAKEPAKEPANEPEPQRIWYIVGLEEKKPTDISLSYGVPETDDSFGGFSCKVGSGAVSVWISETSEKLKPGKKATAVLSVGAVKASVAGKLQPNEEAGVPSFDGGSLPASDPLFAALAEGKELVVTVGPSKDTAPLKGAAEKVKKFISACAKK